jgi:hypothetical protein
MVFVEDNIGKKAAAQLPLRQRWQGRTVGPSVLHRDLVEPGRGTETEEAMTAAGSEVFGGSEPLSESIKETKKNQNLTGDMLSRVHTILGHGLEVLGGFIVGFDSDGPDIFDRQVEFIQKAGVPTAMLGVLQALPNTPLETRMRAEGRLEEMPRPQDQFGRANFKTVLPAPVLLAGYRRALEALYEPKAYFSRVREMMRLRRRLPQIRPTPPMALVWALRAIVAQGLLASYRRDYWQYLRDIWRWDKTRLVDAIRHAAPGHHFLLFTRKVVGPRLEAALEGSPRAAEIAPRLGADAREALG